MTCFTDAVLGQERASDDFSTVLEKYSMYQIKSNYPDKVACKAQCYGPIKYQQLRTKEEH